MNSGEIFLGGNLTGETREDWNELNGVPEMQVKVVDGKLSDHFVCPIDPAELSQCDSCQ